MIRHYGNWSAAVDSAGPCVFYLGWHAFGPFDSFAHADGWAADMFKEDPNGEHLPSDCLAVQKVRST